jgi:hypothetical protein
VGIGGSGDQGIQGGRGYEVPTRSGPRSCSAQERIMQPMLLVVGSPLNELNRRRPREETSLTG